MTTIDNRPDYSIEVPGLGFIGGTGFGPSDVAIVDESKATYSSDRSSAEKALEQVQKAYTRLGLVDTAASARIITRTVTVTRGDWEPFVPDLSAADVARYRRAETDSDPF